MGNYPLAHHDSWQHQQPKHCINVQCPASIHWHDLILPIRSLQKQFCPARSDHRTLTTAPGGDSLLWNKTVVQLMFATCASYSELTRCKCQLRDILFLTHFFYNGFHQFLLGQILEYIANVLPLHFQSFTVTLQFDTTYSLPLNEHHSVPPEPVKQACSDCSTTTVLCVP